MGKYTAMRHGRIGLFRRASETSVYEIKSRYINRFPTIRATVSAIMASVSLGRMLWRVANSLT